MLNFEKCPACGSTRVRRASSFWRHWGRWLAGSHKRFCKACGNKWHIEARVFDSLLTAEDYFIVACIIVVPVVIGLATHPYFLKDWAKTQVRGYYDAKYGPESRKHLWRDLGGLYGGRGAAVNDYGVHEKKPPP